MIILNKITITLTVTLLLIFGILVDAQIIGPPPKSTTTTTTTHPPPPPPPPPPTPTIPIRPPFPIPSQPSITSKTPAITTTPFVPPPPPPPPPPTSQSSPAISKQVPPPLPTSSTSKQPDPIISPTPTVTPCVTCSDPTTFCNPNSRLCQPKGKVGDTCNNDNECSDNLICGKNLCRFKSKSNNDDGEENFEIKKVGIVGGIIVGTTGVIAIVFFIGRYYIRKKSLNGRKIPSFISSNNTKNESDDNFEPIYPFTERSNAFSNEMSKQKLSNIPTNNHYDPMGNTGFSGSQKPYFHYNKNDFNGQKEQGITRTINLLQQTRGNVIPPAQQNYGRNYRYPPQHMMNQGGLFPIPSVGNYGSPVPNNMNIPSPRSNITQRNESNSTSSDNVKHGSSDDKHDKHKFHNMKNRISRTFLKTGNNLSPNSSQNGNNEATRYESIYDCYTQDSKNSNNNNNNHHPDNSESENRDNSPGSKTPRVEPSDI